MKRDIKIKRLKKDKTYSDEELEELGYELIEEQRVIIGKNGLSYVVLDVGNGNYIKIRSIRRP